MKINPVLEDRVKYTRLRAKATALLLDATPKSLSAEIVSLRVVHPTHGLFEIMEKLQPGGLEEMNQLLIKLEEVPSSESAEEAVRKLLAWERRAKRVKELKLVIPDSSRLMSALMKMVAKPPSADGPKYIGS